MKVVEVIKELGGVQLQDAKIDEHFLHKHDQDVANSSNIVPSNSNK